MSLRPVLTACALLLGSCQGGTTTFAGLQLSDALPLDDAIRNWTFQSDDNSIAYRLLMTQDPEFETDELTLIHSLKVVVKCFGFVGICDDADDDDAYDAEGMEVSTWRMSSNSFSGISFHGAGGVTFDPPVKLAEDRMVLGDTVVTESGGITWTATFVSEESCPAPLYFPSEETRPECFKLTLDDGGADSEIAGTYWLVGTYGLVAFQISGEEGRTWALQDYEGTRR